MSDWQDWAVTLLLILCVGRIIFGVVRSFRRAGRGENPCSHCAGCSSSRSSSRQICPVDEAEKGGCACCEKKKAGKKKKSCCR